MDDRFGQAPRERTKPRLRVLALNDERSFVLDGPEITIGRSAAADIRIELNVVSGVHARLVRDGASYRFIHMGKTNPTLIEGVPVESRLLQHGDCLDIAPSTASAVRLVFELSEADVTTPDLGQTLVFKPQRRGGVQRRPAAVGRLVLPPSGTVTVGRSPENDLVLPNLNVSRLHAKLDIHDGAVILRDEESANGTYVNGVTTQTRKLAVGDIVRIGPYKLVYRDGAIEHYDDSRAVRLDVHEVTQVFSGRRILDSVSFNAQPGEVLAIAGTSGAGKSTLIDALNGLRPPVSGNVLVNGADLYRSYNAVRPLIGYVPQESILPLQLSVERALNYAARLRLPPDVGGAAVRERVEEVMRSLDLYHRRDVPIGRLSGGQQKRASIAAELIANPGLFFLDEPTSGLDPGLTQRVAGIVRELAVGGSTIVLISHDVESLQAADRLVFLASGGRLVFIGTPAEALSYFEVDAFAEIYRQVEASDSAEWQQRFRQSDQYRQRVAPGLLRAAPQEGEESAERGALRIDPAGLVLAGARRSASAWRQFRITTARYAETLYRDRRNLGLLLLQAPVIAVFLALVAKQGDLHPPPQLAIDQAASFGISAAKLGAALPVMLAASATWFGAINAAREIVKEAPILRRERLAGLRVAPYLGSKVVVLMLLCLLQTAALLGIVWAKVDVPSSGRLLWGPLELWISLDLAAFAALGLGLLISASMANADRAQSLVPILLIPQIIFVGGPDSGTAARWLSYLTVTHWSVEAMKITAGIPYKVGPGGYERSDLLLHWLALAVMASAFVGLAAWQLGRRRDA